MDTCIFCKIIAGTIPSYKIFENDRFMAFLDIRPLSPGHSLIIPKEHHRWVWDVPNIGEYFEVAQKIALAQQKAFSIDAIHSKIVGEEVPHAHIWIYPDPSKVTAEHGDAKDFEAQAAKIRAFLGK